MKNLLILLVLIGLTACNDLNTQQTASNKATSSLEQNKQFVNAFASGIYPQVDAVLSGSISLESALRHLETNKPNCSETCQQQQRGMLSLLVIASSLHQLELSGKKLPKEGKSLELTQLMQQQNLHNLKFKSVQLHHDKQNYFYDVVFEQLIAGQTYQKQIQLKHSYQTQNKGLLTYQLETHQQSHQCNAQQNSLTHLGSLQYQRLGDQLLTETKEAKLCDQQLMQQSYDSHSQFVKSPQPQQMASL